MFRNRFAFLLTFTLFTCLLLTRQIAAQSAEDPSRYQRNLTLDPGALPAAGVPAAADDDVQPHFNPVTIDLVYSRLIEGNWELFIIQNGTTPRRLTFTAANEVMPALNRSATQIAFVSNRDGRGYNLYVMNTNGGHVRRLTDLNTQAFAYGPAWAPDNSRIAYYSGSSDRPTHVYTIDPAGGAPSQVSTRGAWNGHPSYAPDGSLVYSSYRDGGYRIWRAAFGAQGERQLTDLAYSATPYVSPDGERLAFTADADRDGWEEIYIQKLDGSAREQLITDPGRTGFEARGFTPDGLELYYNALIYTRVNNTYYLTNLRYGYLHMRPHHSPGRLSESLMLDPATNTHDTGLPRVRLGPVAQLAPAAAALHMTWRGQDAGPAGVRAYDLESTIIGAVPTLRRIQGDEYGDLPPPDGTTVSGQAAGTTVHWRVRAVDRVYNIGNWGADRSHTTFYRALALGRVADMRGAPVDWRNVPHEPPVEPIGYRPDDDAFLQTFNGNAATMRVERIGYSAPPAWQVPDRPAPAPHRFVLGAADEAIANGQFEQPTPTGWQTVGQAQIVPTAHSGTRALRLGPAAQWADLPADREMYFPPQVLTPDGRYHRIDDYQYPLRVFSGGGGQPLEISTPPGLPVNWSYRLLATSDSALHLIAVGPRETLLYRRLPGTAWEAPLRVPATAADLIRDEMSLVADGLGGYYLAWVRALGGSRYTVAAHYRAADGTLSPIVALPDADVPPHSALSDRWPQIVVLADGSAHILYDRLLIRRTADGRSDVAIIADQFSDYLYVNRPQLVVNAAGQRALVALTAMPNNVEQTSIYDLSDPGNLPPPVHLAIRGEAAFMDDAGVVHVLGVVSDGNGLRSLVEQLVGPDGWTLPPRVLSPVIWPDLSRQRFVFLPDLNGSHVLLSVPIDAGVYKFSVRRWQGDGWSPVFTTDQPRGGWLSTAAALLAPNGNLLVTAWRLNEAALFEGSAPAAATTTDGVRQRVTVPAAAAGRAPTLSLRYRLLTPVAGDGGLHVLIDDGRGAQRLLTGATYGDWQHAWADLTPWAGQTVTLTLAVPQAAGMPAVGVLVDEVSVGSAYADWAVRLDSPIAIQPGGQAVTTLYYANRGGVAALPATLHLTLPPNITLLAADPPPQSVVNGVATWQLGAQPAGGVGQIALTLGGDAVIVPGGSAPARALISGSTPELERANNQVLAYVVVQHRVFVPAVVRP